MNRSKLLLLTFAVTAIYDVILQFLSRTYKDLPKALKYNFIKYLRGYFRNHTILGAAAVAGLTGMIVQLIIISILKFPREWVVGPIINFLILSFLVSGLFGFVMQASKLYPHLEETYYKKLGPVKGFVHDGVSGIIVQITLFVLYGIKDYFKI